MNTFPQESIQKAKEIAEQYKHRSTTKAEIVSRLFDMNFLEVNYGFSDAVKTGRCGHFLHQLKYDADCFSLAGMLYLIAKESNLQPKIYNMSKMKSVSEHEISDNVSSADHTFISVKLGQDEILVDPFYGTKAKIKKHEPYMLLLKKDCENGGKEEIKREYTMLEELTEDEYVKHMKWHQSPREGKHVLAAGQTLDAGGRRILVEYEHDKRLLIASNHSATDFSTLSTDSVSRAQVMELEAPITNDGTWLYKNGIIRYYQIKNNGWTRANHVLPHGEIILPYNVVKEFHELMEQTTKHHQRKTSSKTRIKDFKKRFMNYGFDRWGNIVSDTGIDTGHYQTLIKQVDEAIHTMKHVKEVKPDIMISAKYLALRTKGYDEGSFVYSQEERDTFLTGMLDRLHNEYAVPTIELFFSSWLASGGLKPNEKQAMKNLRFAKNKETDVTRLKRILPLRKQLRHIFENRIDSYMFKLQNPLGSITATDEEVFNLNKEAIILNLRVTRPARIALEVRPFRKGLKKILAI